MAKKKSTRKKKTASRTTKRVDSVTHKDKRVNIPTEELAAFMPDDAKKETPVLYPRNPDLDPQLVWKGKDQQDAAPLEVPAVPIYIQEKIHPQAIIDALPRIDHSGGQMDFFSDFNGLPEEFSDRIDFYQHEAHWQNRMILGDSLLVMASLAEKEGLKGKVQTIYFDPPYGIKFGSNWQVSTRKRDVKDGKADDTTRQPEQVRAFRDTWKLGIHSYLAYLRDRLVIARELLTESGSLFVQIGDENVHLVRCILDEVFGSDNFRSVISVKKTAGLGTDSIPAVTDFVLWYAKNLDANKARSLYIPKVLENDAAYSSVEMPDGSRRRMTTEERADHDRLSAGARVFRFQILLSAGRTESCIYSIDFNGRTFNPTAGRSWATNKPGMTRLINAGRISEAGSTLSYIRFSSDFPVNPMTNFWDDTASGSGMDKIYVVQTNAKLIERCLLMTTDPGDLVLDPTCGSGTTAYVAEQWGRRWITTDTSRVALALARTRLITAKFPYYHLADDYPGTSQYIIDKEVKAYLRKTAPAATTGGGGDVRKGFIYKRVPHVTLKSIANNPDIEEGMSREQIDEAIARHADTETLYDKPYEDNKTVRVTGPFTVESLSPHRTISVDEKVQRATSPDADGRTVKVIGPDQFGNMILENLRTAGVQNNRSGERMKFARLEPYPGQWVHGEGEIVEADGKAKRVAVCIGPEHGTVGPDLIKEAAKEAVQGIGFDILVVCGFAFDPHVGEETKKYGKLIVLPTKMNPDLAMGELLKKTGAGNLFMVFGEPDVSVTTAKNGQVTVEIRGLDVYDPTTGEIRSNSTDEIACWFIDTDYNGESFFVRHAYFTGADEPYDKLKRALRAEIDEAAWSELYSTVSRPFDKPSTGKIAVKVINHFGDEVMKVYETA